jgi:ABC-type lipoprotein export system ATPase subunit
MNLFEDIYSQEYIIVVTHEEDIARHVGEL